MSGTGPEPAANVDQARAWDGEEGEHWAAHAERYDAAIREYGPHLQRGAAIAAGEAVLDVGCGNGASTVDAARAASDGRAVGIDLSAAMLARAREKADAAGLTNVELLQGDAQTYPFAAGTFDVAISRFGVMFFEDPVAAFTNIARALTGGGRLALVAWKSLAENEWFSEIGRALAAGRPVPVPEAGRPSPFGLAHPDFVRSTLTAAGFTGIALDTADATYHAGPDADTAFAHLRGSGFTRAMLHDVDADATARALDALHATITAHESARGVTFASAAWLITARRA